MNNQTITELENKLAECTRQLEEARAENARLVAAAQSQPADNLEAETEARLEEFVALAHIAQLIAETANLETILDAIGEQVCKLTGCIAAAVYLKTNDQTTRLAGSYGVPDPVMETLHQILQQYPVAFPDEVSSDLAGLVKTLLSDQIVLEPYKTYPFPMDAPELYRAFEIAGWQTIANVPMFLNGHFLGRLGCYFAKKIRLTPPLERVMRAASQYTVVAVQNAELVNGLRSEVKRREALENAVAQISSELDLSKVLENIITGVVSLMDKPAELVGVVSLVDKEQDRLFVKATVNATGLLIDYGFKQGEGLSGLVWERKAPVILNYYDQLPSPLPPEVASSRWAGVGVPIFWQDEVIGVFGIVSGNSQWRFNQADADLMTMFARHAAIAIENARLYAQSQELAVVEERNRLARELHDTVTQMLYSMTLTSRAAKNFLTKKPERVPAQLDSLEELSRQALAEMRALLLQLHPRELENEGLITALRRLLSEIGNRHNFVTRFDLQYAASPPEESITNGPHLLTPGQEQALYRIAQEGLANIIKHAQAKNIEMSLNFTEQPGYVCFKLKDDGVGLATTRIVADNEKLGSGGLGLRGIRERVRHLNGDLSLTSGPQNKGTLLTITLPLKN